MSKFQAYLFVASLSSLLKEHPMCLTNLLLMIPTAAGEQLLETLAFQCPKDRSLAKLTSAFFLFVPIFVLFVIGVATNMKFWRVCHGCKKNNEGGCTKCEYCTAFCIAVYRSLPVPCVWTFVALLDGTYVVCYFAEEPDELTESTVFIQAMSQSSAWILLFLMVIIGTPVMCINRCCDTYTFLDNVYVEAYWSKKEEETKQRAAKKAEESARNFVAEHNFPEMPENGGRQRGNRNNHKGNETEIDSGIDETDNGNLNSNGNCCISMGPESSQISKAPEIDRRGKMAEPGPSSSSMQQGDDCVKKDSDTS